MGEETMTLAKLTYLCVAFLLVCLASAARPSPFDRIREVKIIQPTEVQFTFGAIAWDASRNVLIGSDNSQPSGSLSLIDLDDQRSVFLQFRAIMQLDDFGTGFRDTRFFSLDFKNKDLILTVSDVDPNSRFQPRSVANFDINSLTKIENIFQATAVTCCGIDANSVLSAGAYRGNRLYVGFSQPAVILDTFSVVEPVVDFSALGLVNSDIIQAITNFKNNWFVLTTNDDFDGEGCTLSRFNRRWELIDSIDLTTVLPDIGQIAFSCQGLAFEDTRARNFRIYVSDPLNAFIAVIEVDFLNTS